MPSSPPFARPRDWRLALIAVNVAVPELLIPMLSALPSASRPAAFMGVLALLLSLNLRIAMIEAARPWAALCLIFTLVAALALGQISWVRSIPYLPLLIAYTPQA